MQLDERAPDVMAEPPRGPKPWLRNAWYAAAWSADLAPGKIVAKTILNEPVIVFRQPNGTPVALADYCPHRFAPLRFGKILPDGNIECGYHGLQFDARGRCVGNPHDDTIPKAAVPSYPILEKYGVAWIWMGPAVPDESALADYSMFENVPPLFSSLQEYLHVDASYLYVLDNLMDASHVPFVHVGTLANGERPKDTLTLEQRGNEVSIHRAQSNGPVMTIIDMQYRSNGRNADTFNTIRWNPPGSILVHSGACDIGADRSTGTGYSAMHLLTPETETTAHYMFWAVRWNPRDPDEAASQEILNVFNTVRRRAFEEQDLPIIIAQARSRARLGAASKPTLFSVDVAAVRFRRVFEQLLAEEARTPTVSSRA